MSYCRASQLCSDGHPLCVLLCQVLCLLLPLRYSLAGIGGSWAQRQVLTFTMIHAALKAKQLKLAMALVSELKVRCRIEGGCVSEG